MKKTLLFALIFMIALSGVFAAPEGFHFGVESHVDYEMVLNNNSEPNKAVFVFNPYISIDNVFLLKLRAQWQPETEGDNAGNNGFDYLFTFDTSDFYTFSSSVLKYIDTLKFHTGLFDFGIVRTDEKDTLRILTDEKWEVGEFHTNYKLYAKLDTAIIKAVVETTDFAKYNKPEALYKGYRAAQHAGAEFNMGLVGIVADLYHEGFFKGSIEAGEFKSHRFIGRAGMKMQTLLKFFEIGNYITTDIVNDTEAGGHSLFDRWMLEVNGKLSAGPFTIDTTLFYNNSMKAYNYLPDNENCFGAYSDARANFNDFVDLRLYALLPITFDPFDFIRDDQGKTYDKFGAEVKVGKWWYVGGGLEINHLISDLERKYSIKEMVDENEVWLKAGIATRNLDVYAKGSIIKLDGFETKLTIGATFRADNFLFYPAE